MATFYIDGEAGTNGAGTYADPYNATPTISSNNTYLYAAGRTLSGGAGTAISVSAGASNVVIGAYDRATGAQLHGGSNKARITTTSGQYTVRVNTNAHNCTIEMLDVDNPSGVSAAHGIYIGNSASLVANGCTVRRCVVHDIAGAGASNGIAFRGSDFSAYENVIHSVPADGIFGHGLRARIYNNTIYDVDRLASAGDCIQVQGDATLACSGAYIADNELANPKGNKQCIITQDTTGGSSGVRILRNNCTIAIGASNQAIYEETVGAVIEANRITGGYHGIFLAGADSVVRSNLVQGVGFNGINQSSSTTGMDALGNTVHGAPSHGIYCGTDTTAAAKNNLLISCVTGLAKHGDATEDYNAFWLCTTNKGNVAGTPAYGSNTITGDPQLTATHRPRAGSPLIGAGTHLGYTRDIERKQRPNPPSIGAYDAATLREV
jgi:hypothetical protein